jgi:hypothetical protein
LFLGLYSCTTQNITKRIFKSEIIADTNKFSQITYDVEHGFIETVKMHMKNGDAYILEIIRRDIYKDKIIVSGIRVDENDRVNNESEFVIKLREIDSVYISDRSYTKDFLFNDSTRLMIRNELMSQRLKSLKIKMMDDVEFDINSLNGIHNDSIIGWGQKVDINRNFIGKGKFKICINDIALIETDVVHPNLNFIGLISNAVITGSLMIGYVVYCALNPKACFGSCPTFYAWDGQKMSLMAEGFSASILPSLEENDIDALYLARPPSRILEIDLTNEAYETHVIRKTDILAVRRKPGNRVISDGKDDFWEVSKFICPSKVNDSKDSSLELLSKYDGNERCSKTDSFNLAKKESIELQFNAPGAKNLGIVIASRQSLVTTFLFYQTLAYMGTNAVSILASIDSDSSSLRKNILHSNDILGGIDIEVLINDSWVKVGTIDEKGPIASDIKLIKLPEGINSPVEIKLIMSKGYVRIDYVSLAEIHNETKPVKLKPDMVYSDGMDDLRAFDCLSQNLEPLITFPGDKYRIVYSLPEDYQNYELFMDTKGYYLEWIRNEWLKEENPAMVYQYFSNPTEYFRNLAPLYKKIEPDIEFTFWNSRYVK